MTLQSEQPIDLLAAVLQKHSRIIENEADLTPLFDRIGNARVVLFGESTHGTHQYYTARAHLSKRLIAEHGFDFIAVEGDWPDCYRVDDFVKGFDAKNTHAKDVLHDFQRWPTWMWANQEVVQFIDWLRQYNRYHLPAGFFGLDVYSL